MRTLIVISLLMLLFACGQKGDLYIPDSQSGLSHLSE